jgi:tetraacyldisaccharide 4'-kinase
MRAPRFWQHDGIAAHLLDPIALLYAWATARRLARPGWHAPVPVICCGNASVGGTGKTTVALDLGARLARRGRSPAFLSRGYGGRRRSRRVDPGRDNAATVGDEPMLLAACAPTYVGPDRAATAQIAVEWGAGLLIMDDGLQNPGLRKDLSLLVIDGDAGIGNGRVLPAGPLREPLEAAASRCQAAVLIGPDRQNLAARLSIPVLRASLESPAEVAGRRLFAFAGIGRPEKFFDGLRSAGADLAGTRAFPDHHRYTSRELDAILLEADRLGAEPATTPKDAARLAPAQHARLRVVGVRLVWDDETAIEALLDQLPRRRH